MLLQYIGGKSASVKTSMLCYFVMCLSWLYLYVFVCVCLMCRRSAVTMALTQMQWRIAVASVWAMAQAARLSIRCLMTGKALVSLTQKMFEQLWTN